VRVCQSCYPDVTDEDCALTQRVLFLQPSVFGVVTDSVVIMLDRLFAPFAGLGELILRLALGLVFLAHGIPKLKNPAELTGLLTKLGIPGAPFFAWLVALLETVGAVLLILGLATRIVALGLTIDMLVAIVSVRIGLSKAPFASGPKGPGWDFEFLLFAGALALVFLGGGRIAIDRYLGL
jgi:putative oxidoreductase